MDQLERYMTCTTVYALTPGQPVDGFRKLTELRNSWGSAPVVWMAMFARYVDRGDPELPGSGFMFRLGELWPLWRRSDIPAPFRAVLGMTYDNAYIERADYSRAAADIRSFLKEFPVDPTYENHWPRIAEIFESAPDCAAIGFNWTSVNRNPFEGDWDEESDQPGPTEWSTKWSFYQEFE